MRKNRVRKSVHRNLRDLDDHLQILREAAARVASGDDTYQKTLAVEMRVLVCRSSGTEGLLWRLIDELNVGDAVHVHLAGNLNRDHPLAKGLSFVFVPVLRAGEGDPRLVPAHYSLREIIKECEATVVSGRGYTHEELIRKVAEQMGSAHEDEGVEPALVQLSGVTISDLSPLRKVILSDADFVLEVGEAVLDRASATGAYERKERPRLPTPPRISETSCDVGETDFEEQPDSLPPEGTALFLVNHPHTDWKTNSDQYDFGVFRKGALTIKAVKHADKTVEICVTGLSHRPMVARSELSESENPGVMIGVTWAESRVDFFVDGERVDRQRRNDETSS